MKSKYKIGQVVYLKTDPDQHERIITGITCRPNELYSYALGYGGTETWHYDIEINSERDVLKATRG